VSSKSKSQYRTHGFQNKTTKGVSGALKNYIVQVKIWYTWRKQLS